MFTNLLAVPAAFALRLHAATSESQAIDSTCGFDPSKIARQVAEAETQTELVTIRDTYVKMREIDVQRALCDAFLDHIERAPESLRDPLLRLTTEVASSLTGLGDPIVAESQLTRCLKLFEDGRGDLSTHQKILCNRGFARLLQKNRGGASIDSELALEVILRPNYPSGDRLRDLEFAWRIRINSASTRGDQLRQVVKIVEVIDRYDLWDSAHNMLLLIRQLIRSHPRHAFDRMWRDQFGTELTANIRLRLREVISSSC
jgi:hypothetical protein